MHSIFSTEERIEILKATICKTTPISVNSIAAKLKLSKGLVSKYLDVLAKEGVVKKADGKYLVVDSALTKGIKVLLNIEQINLTLFKKFAFVEAVGLYGSCAKGENTEESDIDLWIKVKEVSDQKAASLTAVLRKIIKNVKPLLLTAKKIEKMKKEDELFYHSLAFGSIILYGDKDGIQL